MTSRVCSEPGCPTLTEPGSRGGRCLAHRRSHDAARGSRTDRGYGAAHQTEQRSWQAKIDAGEVVRCWRCGEPITGHCHLGHDDNDRTITRGPEHPLCNLSAAGRASHPTPEGVGGPPQTPHLPHRR